jgi:hypothetical protein
MDMATVRTATLETLSIVTRPEFCKERGAGNESKPVVRESKMVAFLGRGSLTEADPANAHVTMEEVVKVILTL